MAFALPQHAGTVTVLGRTVTQRESGLGRRHTCDGEVVAHYPLLVFFGVTGLYTGLQWARITARLQWASILR